MIKETESRFRPVNETASGYSQLITALIRRRFWLLGVLFSVLAVATIYSLTTKPKYQSSMQLLIEPNVEGKSKELEQAVNNQAPANESNLRLDDYATQINVMRSSLLLQRAVNLLNSQYPDLSVETVKNSLTLRQLIEGSSNTKIVSAAYVDEDPVRAKEILSAIYRVYQVYNREQQEQRLKKGLKFINEQIPAVRQLVEQSESQLEKFRRSNSLINPEQQATDIAQSLNAIEQERQAIRAQYQDNQSRYNELQKQLARSPEQALTASRLSQSERYQGVLNELQKTEMALAQRRATFTDEDPSVQKLLEQRRSQLEMLQSEVGRVLGAGATQVNANGEEILTQGQLGGLDQNLTSQLVEVQTNLGALKARDDSLAQTQKQFRTELTRFPSLLSEYNRLQPSVQVNRDKLQQLLKTQQDLSLEIARGGYGWQALEEPQLGRKIAPNLQLNLLLALGGGLLLGSFVALLREAVDDAVHSPKELEQQGSLPLLGTIPELSRHQLSEPIVTLPFGNPEAIAAPWTVQVSNWIPTWESRDLIYKNIQLLHPDSEFKSLTITSALPSEGKSILSLGLALSAARLHQKVLLIDADLRRPSLHRMLNLPNDLGLSTLLSGEAEIPAASSVESSGSVIDVLTAGPTPHDPANLLSSPRMRELMESFAARYDLILLDTPPVLGIVDSVLAASLCSGVLLVSRVGQVTKSELAQATNTLSKLNLIGMVANGDSQASHSRYAAYTRETPTAMLNKAWG